MTNSISIQIAGADCPACNKLDALCREVVADLGLQADFEKINKLDRIVELGIFVTPGLIINDKIYTSGKIPLKSTLRHWITDAAGIKL